MGIMILTSEALFEARVYRQDSGEFLFYHYNTKVKTDSLLTLKHFYLMLDKSLAAEDTVVLQKDLIISAHTRFPIVGEEGVLTRINNKLLMQSKTVEKEKEKLLDFPEELLVGPIFVDFITKKWSELLSGEKIKITLPAPNVLRVADFDLHLVENKYSKLGYSVIKMNVSSLFLRFFIDSSYFVFDNSTRRLREIHGATILKTKNGNRWSNTTNASIYYTYPDESKF